MPEPINYMAMVPQPNISQDVAGGLALGGAIGGAIADKRYKDAMFDAYQNPTPDKFIKLQLQYPDKAAGIKGAWDALDSAQQDAIFRNGIEISNAMRTGNVDVAKQKLQTTIDANKNAGRDASQYEHILNTLDSGNTNGAITAADLFLSSANPKKYEDIYKARQSRAEEEKTGAEAKIKGEEAARAKEAQQAALDKAAADLGLTKAQTNKTLVETNKLGVEAQKAALELEGLKATGGVDPDKKFQHENTIRNEYQGRTKNYNLVRDSYATIDASAKDKTGAGDIALITSFMKMLDPGSVVRETEFATARDTAGLATNLANQLEKVKSGSFLSDEQRKGFQSLAKQYVDAADKREGQIRDQYKTTVKKYGLDYENVFGEPEKTEQDKAKEAAKLRRSDLFPGEGAPVEKKAWQGVPSLGGAPAAAPAATGIVLPAGFTYKGAK